MMAEITALLMQYGLAFVFANLFLQQAGVPVPAVPTLMVAGALSLGGGPTLPVIVLAAVAGSLLGDLIWYIAGRLYGFRVLQLFCRISISPPVAGALQLPVGPFLAYSTIGAALYAVAAAGAGVFFYREIDWLIGRLEAMGIYALIAIGLALAVYIAFKWWDRMRFFKALRMARLPVPELRRMMDEGHDPLVVDVRSASARSLDPRRIPGAVAVDIEKIDEHLSGLPPDRDIILYCA